MRWPPAFIAPLLLVLLACSAEDAPFSIGGTVVGDAGPVAGAVVRVGERHRTVRTDEEGHFSCPTGRESGEVVVSAFADGYFITRVGAVAVGTSDLEIHLLLAAGVDDPDYEWVSSRARDEVPESCEPCHRARDGTMVFDEWARDAHARAAINPRFLNLYEGTDREGRRSPPTRFVNRKDYGPTALPPDPSRPYHGPGYRLDWPETAGNCATCHVPTAAVREPYGTHPAQVSEVEAEGVSCDFCHKVADVVLNPKTDLPYPNRTGVLSFELHRPPEGHQFFASPFEESGNGGSYTPLLRESHFCAPCHHAEFWGTLVYDSYGEWLASDYADPESGRTCQDCHMPSRGTTRFAPAEVGGVEHPPASVHRHDMSINALLTESAGLEVAGVIRDGTLDVEVRLTNDRTGHHLPTGTPLRHLILVVTATDGAGEPLPPLDGPRNPDWSGEYAGTPGRTYARVLEDAWLGTAPTAAYWNPTHSREDNRLAAGASDTTRYRFAALETDEATLTVRLWYRRAFAELARQKGWELQDTLMEEETARVYARDPGDRR